MKLSDIDDALTVGGLKKKDNSLSEKAMQDYKCPVPPMEVVELCFVIDEICGAKPPLRYCRPPQPAHTTTRRLIAGRIIVSLRRCYYETFTDKIPTPVAT